MTILSLSLIARRDRINILAYVASEGGSPAEISRNFDAIYERIAIYPKSCQLQPTLGAGVRVAVANPYLILYKYYQKTDELIILRILHGRRKITSDFMKMP